MRRLIILFILLLIVPPLHAQVENLAVGDEQRTFYLHIPRNLNTPAALLIVLHGGGGNARQMQRFTDFDRIADREGFIVAYPEGIDKAWNDGRQFDGASTATDVEFIAVLIDHLITTQGVDPNRVYATGISNGGFMSFRLACELSDRIAGVAPVTATLSEDLISFCQPAHPIKLLLINGTADPLVTYDGGSVTLPNDVSRGHVQSTADTMRFWAEHNQCDGGPIITDLPNRNRLDRTQANSTQYTNCQQPVQLISIVNGGHTWPGGSQYLPIFLIGRTNRDIDASEVIWDFFASAS